MPRSVDVTCAPRGKVVMCKVELFGSDMFKPSADTRGVLCNVVFVSFMTCVVMEFSG